MIPTVTGDPANLATGGIFCDPAGQATAGMFCTVAFKPPGAGRKRPERRYYADDVDLEQMRIRTRILRDRRDMQDLMELMKLLHEVN